MPIMTLCTILEQRSIGNDASQTGSRSCENPIYNSSMFYNNTVFEGALTRTQMENVAYSLFSRILANHCGRIRHLAETRRETEDVCPDAKEACAKMEKDITAVMLAHGQFPNWATIPFIMDSISYGREFSIVHCYIGINKSRRNKKTTPITTRSFLLAAWPKVTYQFRIFDATPYQDLTRIEIY